MTILIKISLPAPSSWFFKPAMLFATSGIPKKPYFISSAAVQLPKSTHKFCCGVIFFARASLNCVKGEKNRVEH